MRARVSAAVRMSVRFRVRVKVEGEGEDVSTFLTVPLTMDSAVMSLKPRKSAEGRTTDRLRDISTLQSRNITIYGNT